MKVGCLSALAAGTVIAITIPVITVLLSSGGCDFYLPININGEVIDNECEVDITGGIEAKGIKKPDVQMYGKDTIIIDYKNDETGVYIASSSLVSEEASKTAKEIYERLKKKGYSDSATAGILGNLKQESGLNPEADNGYAFGIAQWEGGRLAKLKNWCRSNGYNYRKVEGQIEYLMHDLERDSTWLHDLSTCRKGEINDCEVMGVIHKGMTLQDFKIIGSVENATTIYMNHFERCSHVQSLTVRTRNALAFYQGFSGMNGIDVDMEGKIDFDTPVDIPETNEVDPDATIIKAYKVRFEGEINGYPAWTEGAYYVTATGALIQTSGFWGMQQTEGEGSAAMISVAAESLGDNGDKYWEWYGCAPGTPWCAIFVSWVAEQNGFVKAGIVPKSASCDAMIAWFEARSQYQDSSYIPKTGDLVFFDWGDGGICDHVGIVNKVENGKLYTIEGNCRNAVRQVSYSLPNECIIGYGTPAY